MTALSVVCKIAVQKNAPDTHVPFRRNAAQSICGHFDTFVTTSQEHSTQSARVVPRDGSRESPAEHSSCRHRVERRYEALLGNPGEQVPYKGAATMTYNATHTSPEKRWRLTAPTSVLQHTLHLVLVATTGNSYKIPWNHCSGCCAGPSLQLQYTSRRPEASVYTSLMRRTSHHTVCLTHRELTKSHHACTGRLFPPIHNADDYLAEYRAHYRREHEEGAKSFWPWRCGQVRATSSMSLVHARHIAEGDTSEVHDKIPIS